MNQNVSKAQQCSLMQVIFDNLKSLPSSVLSISTIIGCMNKFISKCLSNKTHSKLGCWHVCTWVQ